MTGAANGIGRAAARLFAAEGATGVAVDRDGAAAEATATEVAGKAVAAEVALEDELAGDGDGRLSGRGGVGHVLHLGVGPRLQVRGECVADG